jgi:predicted kinase
VINFIPTILITGPVGSGKTTVAFEASAQLEAAGIAHALVDADELDRLFPAPPGDPHKMELTQRNLAAVWENLSGAGAPRLILTMVAQSLERELPWVHAAVPGAQITMVRLRTSESTLLERVRRREVGSGEAYHARRSVEQARSMAREAEGEKVIVVETTGRQVVDIAREVLARCGWIA